MTKAAMVEVEITEWSLIEMISVETKTRYRHILHVGLPVAAEVGVPGTVDAMESGIDEVAMMKSIQDHLAEAGIVAGDHLGTMGKVIVIPGDHRVMIVDSYCS
jgi:hypothetical protein